ncbi:MAG: DUF6580 family putative transport protein, partial [Limisphaerales bacterium]
MRCKWSFWLPLGMMVAFAITCWPAMLPERMKNFSAAYAIAFCAGVYFPGRMGWILPLGTLLVLDFCLNVSYYNTSPLSPFTLFKVAAYAGIIWLGTKF